MHFSPQFSYLIWTLDLISVVRTLCFTALTLKAASSGRDADSFVVKSSVVVRREVLSLLFTRS